jgi:hypothetical protein
MTVAPTLSALVNVAFALLLGCPGPASAQVEGGGEAAVQITGYWNGTTDKDKQVIGTLKLVNEKGKDARSFGVTYARSYDPPTIGMDIFDAAEILPAHVVYGREKEVAAFFGAPDGKKATLIGVYYPSSGELVLGSVKFPADGAAAAPAK